MAISQSGRCDVLTQLNDVVLPVESVAVPAGQLLHEALPALKLKVLNGHTAFDTKRADAVLNRH